MTTDDRLTKAMHDLNTAAAAGLVENIPKLAAAVGRAALPPAPERPEWKWLAEAGEDWLTSRGPDRQFLLMRDGKGVLPLGKVGAFIAAGGAGKTMALTQLALAVATGTKWLDEFDVETPGAVLLALAEEDAEEMRRRLFNAAALTLHKNGAGYARKDDEVRALTATALQRIVCLPLAGQRVALVEGAGGSITESPMLADMQARLDAMKDADGGPVEWRLIILDPLSRWSGADTEKDNASATRFVEAVESLAMKTAGRPTVLIAHHTGKNSRGAANDENAARGVTALTDGVRWVASMYPDEIDGWAWLKLPTKSNYTATCKEPLLLRRDDKHGGALRVGTDAEEAAREADREDDRTNA